MPFFFGPHFFRAIRVREAVLTADFFEAAMLSVPRFRAQRLFVASEMARRPAALIRRLFLGLDVTFTGCALVTVSVGCVISRKAASERSIASRCCSKSETIRSMSFNGGIRSL
jgi:hypothetical protein